MFCFAALIISIFEIHQIPTNSPESVTKWNPPNKARLHERPPHHNCNNTVAENIYIGISNQAKCLCKAFLAHKNVTDREYKKAFILFWVVFKIY